MKRLIFHPAVQREYNEALVYYEEEAGPAVAARFESEVEAATRSVRNNPRRFAYYLQNRTHRRVRLTSFPWLMLFRETGDTIRITVLKHEKQRPGYGLRRL